MRKFYRLQYTELNGYFYYKKEKEMFSRYCLENKNIIV